MELIKMKQAQKLLQVSKDSLRRYEKRGLMFNEKIPFFYKSLVESLEERSKSWKKWSLLKKKLTALEIKTVRDLHELKRVSNSGEIPELESAISGSTRLIESKGGCVAKSVQ